MTQSWIGRALGGCMVLTLVVFGTLPVNGQWWDLVNLTESPGYAILLGLGQVLLDTTRANELPMLKAVNYVCLIFAMWTCDVLLQFLKQQYTSVRRDETGNRSPLSQPDLHARLLASTALGSYASPVEAQTRHVADHLVSLRCDRRQVEISSHGRDVRRRADRDRAGRTSGDAFLEEHRTSGRLDPDA